MQKRKDANYQAVQVRKKTLNNERKANNLERKTMLS